MICNKQYNNTSTTYRKSAANSQVVQQVCEKNQKPAANPERVDSGHVKTLYNICSATTLQQTEIVELALKSLLQRDKYWFIQRR